MRRLFTILALLALIVPGIALASPASAQSGGNHITELDITVELQSDGSAVFTERRSISTSSGTEHYIPITDIDGSDVVDFSVSEDGVPLSDDGSWDTNRTIEEKAGKYGIVHTADGVELCWGIGHHGESTFDVTYTITNFVQNLEDDAQAIYWTFVSRGGDSISDLDISIVNADGSSFNDIKVWGFGYSGTTAIGQTELTAEADHVYQSDYVTILVIFPADVYATSGSMPYTADSIEELAKQGSDWDPNIYDSDEGSGGYDPSGYQPSGFGFPPNFMFNAISKVFFPAIVLLVLLRMSTTGKIKRPTGFKPTNPDMYWRDIPRIDFPLASELVRNSPPDTMSAFFLRWIEQGVFTPRRAREDYVFFKGETHGLEINHGPESMTEIETELWRHVRFAVGNNNILEGREMNQLYADNPSAYRSWRDRVRDESQAYLLTNGFLVRESNGGFFNRQEFQVTRAGQELVDQIHGLKKYLLDYSLIAQREPINVHLWQDYLVWAAFLGIADEVEAQFNLVDPNYLSSIGHSSQSIRVSRSIANSAHSGFRSRSSGSSSSFSGRGGRSSSRGGGSRSRGGGGGGTR